MTQEAYVSFEVAKLLKEKGFEIDTSKDYWKIGEDGTMYFISSIGAYTSDINNKFAFYRPADTYPCPTQQMAMRWLREKHKLFISIYPCYGMYNKLSWSIIGLNYDCDWITKQAGYASRYEEAVEAAIKYCLENLIKND